MSDNPVLDVAIGLVFVYVLYSLLATTVKEFLASVYSYRGRMLERGIEQMLDGQNWGYYWWNWLYNFVVWHWHKNNLGIGKQDFLRNKALPAALTLKYPDIRRARLDRKSKLFASRVFNHPLYKRMSPDNWLSTKPAYLPADVFSKIIVDLLCDSPKTPILMGDVTNGIGKAGSGLHTETKNILTLYSRQANGDLQSFTRQVEGWYNDTMDRVSGWYKKQASLLLLLIGFIMAMIFNVSTIEIVSKLSTDKPARDAMVRSASAYVQQHAGGFNSKPLPVSSPTPVTPAQKNDYKLKKDTTGAADNSLSKKSPSPPVQSDSAHRDTAYDKALTAVTKIKALYGNDIAQQNNTLGLGWGDFGYKADSLDAVKKHQPIPKRKSWNEKVGFVLCACWSFKKIVGLLLTAFAVSLGAPFWFDLLNKFINLRNAGKKPDDTDSGSGTNASGKSKSLPNSFA